MEADANPIKEVLDDLFTLLEALESHNMAVLEFLKAQGIASDDKLAPYLEQAGNASSVKWRAARARMNHLLAAAPKKSSEPRPAAGSKSEETETGEKKPKEKQPEENRSNEPNSQEAGRTETEVRGGGKDAAEKDGAPPTWAPKSERTGEKLGPEPKLDAENSPGGNTDGRGKDQHNEANKKSPPSSENVSEKQKGSTA